MTLFLKNFNGVKSILKIEKTLKFGVVFLLQKINDKLAGYYYRVRSYPIGIVVCHNFWVVIKYIKITVAKNLLVFAIIPCKRL